MLLLLSSAAPFLLSMLVVAVVEVAAGGGAGEGAAECLRCELLRRRLLPLVLFFLEFRPIMLAVALEARRRW